MSDSKIFPLVSSLDTCVFKFTKKNPIHNKSNSKKKKKKNCRFIANPFAGLYKLWSGRLGLGGRVRAGVRIWIWVRVCVRTKVAYVSVSVSVKC